MTTPTGGSDRGVPPSPRGRWRGRGRDDEQTQDWSDEEPAEADSSPRDSVSRFTGGLRASASRIGASRIGESLRPGSTGGGARRRFGRGTPEAEPTSPGAPTASRAGAPASGPPAGPSQGGMHEAGSGLHESGSGARSRFSPADRTGEDGATRSRADNARIATDRAHTDSVRTDSVRTDSVRTDRVRTDGARADHDRRPSPSPGSVPPASSDPDGPKPRRRGTLPNMAGPGVHIPGVTDVDDGTGTTPTQGPESEDAPAPATFTPSHDSSRPAPSFGPQPHMRQKRDQADGPSPAGPSGRSGSARTQHGGPPTSGGAPGGAPPSSGPSASGTPVRRRCHRAVPGRPVQPPRPCRSPRPRVPVVRR